MPEATTARRATPTSYPALDVAKLVAAVWVVQIHANPLLVPDMGLSHMVPAAVSLVFRCLNMLVDPFFFVASGFLCFRRVSLPEMSDARSPSTLRVRRTMSRLLLMYVVWTVAYLPATVLGGVLDGRGALVELLRALRGVLLAGSNYCSWQLWYLLASVVGLALVYLMLRSGASMRAVLATSLSLYAVGYALNLIQATQPAGTPLATLSRLYTLVFVVTYNGPLYSFFYLALGAWLGLHERDLARLPAWPSALVASCGLVLLALALVPRFSPLVALAQMLLCIACTTATFLLLLRPRARDATGGRLSVVRDASTVCYLSHMLFVVLYVHVLCGSRETYYGMSPAVDHVALFAFVLGCTLALSFGVAALRRRLDDPWLLDLVFFGRRPKGREARG